MMKVQHEAVAVGMKLRRTFQRKGLLIIGRTMIRGQIDPHLMTEGKAKLNIMEM